MKNDYDISTVDDLREELGKKLKKKGGKTSTADQFIAIVLGCKEAGYPAMDINHVEAVAFRRGMHIPQQSTIRAYLNKGVERGQLEKPTRATYAPAKA